MGGGGGVKKAHHDGHAHHKPHAHTVHDEKGTVLGTIDHKDAGAHKPGASFVRDEGGKLGKPHYDRHQGRGLDEWKGRNLSLIEAKIRASELAPKEASQQEPSAGKTSTLITERIALSGKKGEEFQEVKTILQKGLLSPSIATSSSKIPPVVEKALVAFLKVFYSWFAKGEGEAKKQEFALPPGQERYAKKEEKAWVDFGKRFLPFVMGKKTDWKNVEKAVYRGMVQNPPEFLVSRSSQRERAEKVLAILFSDLKFMNGKSEKFAQLLVTNPLQYSQMLQRLSSLQPGDPLAKAVLAEWFGGSELSFLVLSHRVVQPDLAKAFKSALTESVEARSVEGLYQPEVTKGIALSARTEEIVARELDLKLRPTAQEGVTDEGRGVLGSGQTPSVGEEAAKTIFGFRKKRKRGGMGGADIDEILIPGFVPWYELVFKPRKWKGRPRWWVPLLYLIAASTIGLGSVYVFKFLLQR
ncbi:MAG: hypothetical protein HYT76_04280 [Deltaproteobacteria bacterium]|nr:hypothetical protein [Deltaproteobacteria bacterium]